ncbi:hypothetical protein AB0F88_34810 [Streptosporangium sp. NPDC023963]|uniref:hypothetical protein n=1 Tax=Streptosporangium sp. NPDC023963 TaxID=3155608 RepID=UPI0034468042
MGIFPTPSSVPPKVLTPRQKRGLEIAEREDELRDQWRNFDRERTRIFQETGRKVSGKESQVSKEEKAVRAELRALEAERAALLKQITDHEAKLRPKQAEYDRIRSGAKQAGKHRKILITKAERKVRAELARLQSERAYVDGTVRRDRISGQVAEAVWNTCHDPETFGSEDW